MKFKLWGLFFGLYSWAYIGGVVRLLEGKNPTILHNAIMILCNVLIQEEKKETE